MKTVPHAGCREPCCAEGPGPYEGDGSIRCPPRGKQLLGETQGSSPLGGSSSLLSLFHKWEHRLRESKGKSRAKQPFFFKTQEKLSLFERFSPALLSGFAFQEQNKSQAKKLGTGASPVLRWRGASALGLCSKLSGLSLVPSPLPDSPLWPQLRKTQAHK